jgi:hypothetical protein
MTLMPDTPGLPVTSAQALRRVLFAGQNDDGSGIVGLQPGFWQVIVRARKRRHLRIYTEDVLRTIEDWDNKEHAVSRDVRSADRSAL